jgi:hypothetical protein
MNRKNKTSARFVIYAATTVTTASRTTVIRTLEDDEGNLRTFGTADEAIAAWESDVRAEGSKPREFSRDGTSRFYEVVRRGAQSSVLYHLRVWRVAE